MKWTNIGVTTTVDDNTLPIHEIWMEGYSEMGDMRATAQRLGWGRGNTFNEAVAEYVKRTGDTAPEWREDHWSTYFGLLFNNEKDARKSRG